MDNILGLFEKKDNVYVSTKIIAEKFNKGHKDIIYSLEGRISKNADGGVEIRNRGLINDFKGRWSPPP